MAGQDVKPPRVAIQFGASSSTSSATKSRSKPSSSLGKRHRARALDHNSESEPEDEVEGRHEEITGYGPGGAKKDEHPRKHRRERSLSHDRIRRRSTSRSRYDDRRHGHHKSRESRHERSNGDREDARPGDEDRPVQYGLTINRKAKDDSRSRAEHDDDNDGEDERRGADRKKDRGPRSADDEAIAALMGEPDTPKRGSNLDSTDQYRSLPIEDFGASLLKGFGWDGKMKGKVAETRKHGNLTGLGSKGAKEAEDLGAWEQKKNKSRRIDDYQREEEKRRQQRDERHGDSSYKREREREREREKEKHRERR